MNKIDEVAILLKEHAVHVAAKTETWLSSHISNSVVSIEGYNIIRRDREHKIGGGVALYIRNDLPFKRWKECENTDYESLWITIRPSRMPRSCSHICVGVVYHPKGGIKATDRAMCDHIISSVDHITKIHPYAGVMIMGDFNRMEDRLLKSEPSNRSSSPLQETKQSWIVYTQI